MHPLLFVDWQEDNKRHRPRGRMTPKEASTAPLRWPKTTPPGRLPRVVGLGSVLLYPRVVGNPTSPSPPPTWAYPLFCDMWHPQVTFSMLAHRGWTHVNADSLIRNLGVKVLRVVRFKINTIDWTCVAVAKMCVVDWVVWRCCFNIQCNKKSCHIKFVSEKNLNLEMKNK